MTKISEVDISKVNNFLTPLLVYYYENISEIKEVKLIYEKYKHVTVKEKVQLEMKSKSQKMKDYDILIPSYIEKFGCSCYESYLISRRKLSCEKCGRTNQVNVEEILKTKNWIQKHYRIQNFQFNSIIQEAHDFYEIFENRAKTKSWNSLNSKEKQVQQMLFIDYQNYLPILIQESIFQNKILPFVTSFETFFVKMKNHHEKIMKSILYLNEDIFNEYKQKSNLKKEMTRQFDNIPTIINSPILYSPNIGNFSQESSPEVLQYEFNFNGKFELPSDDDEDFQFSSNNFLQNMKNSNESVKFRNISPEVKFNGVRCFSNSFIEVNEKLNQNFSNFLNSLKTLMKLKEIDEYYLPLYKEESKKEFLISILSGCFDFKFEILNFRIEMKEMFETPILVKDGYTTKILMNETITNYLIDMNQPLDTIGCKVTLKKKFDSSNTKNCDIKFIFE
eukprot:gene1991-1499_t